MSAKQKILFDCFKRYILCTGPRRSGKSLGCAIKVLRHAYDVPKARVCIISKNIKLAKEGGPWSDLVDIVIPEWEAAGVLKMVTPPKLDAQTRSLYCEVSNRYGGVTRIYLASLEYDDDAERLMKSRRFSLIWICEATNFKKRSLFDTAIQSLRIPGLPYEQHQIILDCNPPDDGQNNWIWKLFWGERLAENPPEQHKTDAQKESYRKFQQQLCVIEIFIPDNPWLSKEEIDELYAQYSYDQDILARYFYGLWVTSSSEGYFSQHFKPAIHVLGDVLKPNKSDWDVILIPETTDELYLGWDMGDKNSVTTFAYKEPDEEGRSIYSFIDEVVVENDSVEISDYVDAVVNIMAKWDSFVGHPIKYHSWSDTSAWCKKLSAEHHEATLVYELSRRRAIADGAMNRVIHLQMVNKYKGSVKYGIKLMKRLLFENRLFVSANCVNLIAMFRSFKPERARGTGIERVPDNVFTHRFDSSRYLLTAEEPLDLVVSSRTRLGKAPSRIVSLG
jgi:PBSX family phage terminase large subunit